MELPQSVMVVLQVLQPFEAGDVVEVPVLIRQVLVEVHPRAPAVGGIRVQVRRVVFPSRIAQMLREPARSRWDVEYPAGLRIFEVTDYRILDLLLHSASRVLGIAP